MEQKIRRDRNMGANLRRLRTERGVSQEKLCAELQRRGCDIGRTTYAKYESGELNIRASVLIELRKITACPSAESSAGWASGEAEKRLPFGSFFHAFSFTAPLRSWRR